MSNTSQRISMQVHAGLQHELGVLTRTCAAAKDEATRRELQRVIAHLTAAVDALAQVRAVSPDL
jgi:alkylhydroperoxidase/carboxymuconolactone decarboxylase family protein YurZ